MTREDLNQMCREYQQVLSVGEVGAFAMYEEGKAECVASFKAEIDYWEKIVYDYQKQITSNTFRSQVSGVMCLAWQMAKRNGYTMSEALKTAWANVKLRAAMKERIVKFYFQKVDGSICEAYETLRNSLLSDSKGTDGRKKSDTVQTYFDTEQGEFRCFKKASLIKIG